MNNINVSNNKTKRSYTIRHPEYWQNRKKKSPSKIKKNDLNREIPGPESISTVFNRNGIPLQTDENLVNQLVKRTLENQELNQYIKFDKSLGPVVTTFLQSFHKSENSPDNSSKNLIPNEIGKVVSDYCKDWDGEKETVLTQFSDFCFRTYVGIMKVLEISTHRVVTLEKEIMDLRRISHSQSVDTPMALESQSSAKESHPTEESPVNIITRSE